jgi:formylmethanofuran dehydrogenase subunit E
VSPIRVFQAHYSGRCADCDGSIEVGDDVAYQDGGVVCEACFEDDGYDPFDY